MYLSGGVIFYRAMNHDSKILRSFPRPLSAAIREIYEPVYWKLVSAGVINSPFLSKPTLRQLFLRSRSEGAQDETPPQQQR